MNQDFNQQQYNDKLAHVAKLAVTYAKDGTGYHSMKDAFNELCEISHANKGINLEENTSADEPCLCRVSASRLSMRSLHTRTSDLNSS
jgi:hypothetical protein